MITFRAFSPFCVELQVWIYILPCAALNLNLNGETLKYVLKLLKERATRESEEEMAKANP